MSSSNRPYGYKHLACAKAHPSTVRSGAAASGLRAQEAIGMAEAAAFARRVRPAGAGSDHSVSAPRASVRLAREREDDGPAS